MDETLAYLEGEVRRRRTAYADAVVLKLGWLVGGRREAVLKAVEALGDYERRVKSGRKAPLPG